MTKTRKNKELKMASRKPQRASKEFQDKLKRASKKLQDKLKRASIELQDSLKRFQRSFKRVLKVSLAKQRQN